MGNSQGRESRPASSRGLGRANAATHDEPSSSRHGRSGSGVYSSRSGRGSRHDLSFLGIGGSSERDPALEPRRETKAEREARKLEKERQLRALERERSIREEGVDGGFLVTLGTYTGPEDFNKSVVRQLQIERRLAPFWKGLNDHEDTWTEHQIVSVVEGKPLPAPDEIPSEEPPRPTNLSAEWNPRTSNTNIDSLTVPINSRSMSQTSDRSSSLSPSHPAFSLPSPTSPIASSPFFRGRAKTLAALTTGSRNASQTEMTPQEIQLPKDPYVNGQRTEVFLYKNASECPICFLYYPPYLNKTRCCDQPICSECFVQIKRPDPHPPEHHDGPSDGQTPPEPQEDGMLVSEPACCPFCVQPEFGVTYEPPPFRRGLSYANQPSLASAASAMSSSSSVNTEGIMSPGRRRAGSLAANDKSVITTDRVRPDWAKKLADARAHALRRAAAATALHNAAYMMGNVQPEGRSFGGLGRRRRTMFGSESTSSSGQGTPRREGDLSNMIAAAAQGSSNRNEGQNDIASGRQSSRRGNRLEDLEELMMMEAIRLSLAAEEERKKKEEKEAAKEAKKEEKKKAKDAKKADKAARKSGFFLSSNHEAGEDSLAGSVSAAGKGKAVDRSGGFASPLSASSSKDESQKHLEESRAQIQQEATSAGSNGPSDLLTEQGSHRAALRNLSNASSSMSSLVDSLPGSHRHSQISLDQSPNASGVDLSADAATTQGAGTEPMFNFNSLTAAMTGDEGKNGSAQHIEDVAPTPAKDFANTPSKVNGESHSPTPNVAVPLSGAPQLPELEPTSPLEESVSTLKPSVPSLSDTMVPSIHAEHTSSSEHLSQKHIGDVSVMDPVTNPQTTQ